MGEGPTRPVYKRRVSWKILRYFIVASVLPVALLALVLANTASEPLLKTAGEHQEKLVTNSARQVDRYLDALTSHLDLAGAQYAHSPEQVDEILVTLVREDPDLQKVSIVVRDRSMYTATRQGETIDTQSHTISSSVNPHDELSLGLLDEKTQFLKFSSDGSKLPQTIIGVPIYESAQTNTGFIGGILGYYETSDETWRSVLPVLSVDQKAYISDDKNQLVYPTDGELSGDNAGNLVSSEATKNGWEVVIKQPIITAHAGFYAYIFIAIIATAVAVGGAVLMSLAFTWRLTRPVKRLLEGARRIVMNNFSQPLDIKTHDEYHELSDIFNALGLSLNSFINNMQSNKRDLNGEQSQLQSIINSVHDGIIAINAHHEIISINPSAARLVTHITPPLTGRPLAEVFPWMREGQPLIIDTTYPGVISYEGVVLQRGESTAYLNLSVEVTDREASNVSAIITIHDQTSTRELGFLKLDLVAIAAHELRTPLTVISGYLDTLNREAIHSLTTENVVDLQKAIIGTRQLRELVNRLLNIARIERGDMEIYLDKLNLTEMVATSVEQHQPIAAQKEQVLSFTPDVNGTIFVPADPGSITEVLNNLIGNAIKYTPDGGQIRVNMIASTTEVRVEVMDNGPGVPAELREKLFSKFYRAERSMITGTRGTGLGLFISKTVIELQRGTIGISPDQGRGSTFYFTLPIYVPERDDALITQNVSRGKHGWFKKRTNN